MGRAKKALRAWVRERRVLWYAYKWVSDARVALSRMVPDRLYARLRHYEETGRWLKLGDPKGLHEKVWWLKLHNRDPRMTRCSDKVSVRSYVAERGFADKLVPAVGVYDRPEDIQFASLPDRAFIKASHASGVNALWDVSEPLDRSAFVASFRKAMKADYFWRSREWNYKGIQPRLLVEEYLEDHDLVDYRFFCFHGQVKLIFVDVETAAPDGTHGNAMRNVYTRDFELLPVRVARDNFPAGRVTRPSALHEMIRMAESLAEGFPFVRVDLYWTNEQIRFGEMTFFPGGGNQVASPYAYELEWGSWLDLSGAV